MNEVNGKVALVTGAGSGIGRACGELLATAGAGVVVTDLDLAAAEATARSISDQGGASLALKQNVTSEEEWDDVIAAVLDRFERLDILVNNAGISGGIEPFELTSLDAWRQVMQINLDGVFMGTQRAVRAMRERGGSIVNISSVMGMVGGAGAAYNASKGGVRLLTKSVAAYCGTNAIPVRVNSVHPGYVWTPMISSLADEIPEGGEQMLRDFLLPKHPIGRLGEPLDIARGVLFLASDDSSFMTGSELVIDGGYTAV